MTGTSVRRACAAVAFVACAVTPAAGEEKIAVDMNDKEGRSVGAVEIVRTPAGALLKVRLAGLPPGAHALRFHETGLCEGDFSSAGAIYNPLGAAHGFLNEDGPMAGDLPNIFADATGKAEADLLSPFVTLDKGVEESIFDADGTALVIFEKGDDYQSDEEQAGARIACGAIGAAQP